MKRHFSKPQKVHEVNISMHLLLFFRHLVLTFDIHFSPIGHIQGEKRSWNIIALAFLLLESCAEMSVEAILPKKNTQTQQKKASLSDAL